MNQGRRPPNFKSMLEAALRGDLGVVPATRAQRGTLRSMRSTVSGYSDLGGSASVVPDNYSVSLTVEGEDTRSRVSASEPSLLQPPAQMHDASRASGHPADVANLPELGGQDAGAAITADRTNTLQDSYGTEHAAAAAAAAAIIESRTVEHKQDELNVGALARGHLTGVLFSDDEE